MAIDLKVTLPKMLVSKTTGHTTSIFQSYRLENKLLQQLCWDIDITIQKIFNEKSLILLNSTGICYKLYGNLLLFIIYIDTKQTRNPLFLQDVICYYLKIKLPA